jgi:hypothetical protein
MYAARAIGCAPCVRASAGTGNGLACSGGRLGSIRLGRRGGWTSAVRLGQQQAVRLGQQMAPARWRVVRVAAEINTPGVRPGTTQRQQAATLLGLQGDEDKRTIKSAFRRLALRCVRRSAAPNPTWTFRPDPPSCDAPTFAISKNAQLPTDVTVHPVRTLPVFASVSTRRRDGMKSPP